MVRYKPTFSSERLLESAKSLLAVLLVLYLSFLIGRAIYLNWSVRQQIKNAEKEIEEIKRENQRLSNLIAYYQTETFRELESRRKLGLKKPGETVVVVPENSDEEQSTKTPPVTEENKTAEKPNYILWWEYLFGGE